jgi:hypothetical protein
VAELWREIGREGDESGVGFRGGETMLRITRTGRRRLGLSYLLVENFCARAACQGTFVGHKRGRSGLVQGSWTTLIEEVQKNTT